MSQTSRVEVRRGHVSVGQPINRVDGRQKVTGGATYAAEFRPEKLAHGILVQSTIAKGRIVSIDSSAASSAPGVIAILTHQNIPKWEMPKPAKATGPSITGRIGDNFLPLTDATIHHAGQNVAVVVAETLEQAQYAASRIQVRYERDKPALQINEGEPKSPESYMGRLAQYHRGDVAAALAAQGVVKVEETYTTPVETNNPMEPHAAVAQWNGDHLIVDDATQAVMGCRDTLSKVFGVPAENVQVRCPYTGGGFGSKGSQWSHTLLAALAARVTKRPVRIALTRPQMFTTVGHRPPTIQKIALAARRDGTLTGILHETTNATSPAADFLESCGPSTSKIMYACENVSTPVRFVRVNVAAPTFMRAPAECIATFAIESAIDELAVSLNMDPIELRMKNRPEKEPSSGKPWSTYHLKECYERGASKFGWSKRNPKPGSMKDGDRLVGWGVATAIYPAHARAASAKIRVSKDGRALVQAATQELGTGAYTVLTQAAAEVLGLPVDRVTFELGDSDFPPAPVSGGSVTTASVSEAVVQAAAALKAKLAELASRQTSSPIAGSRPEDLALSDGKLVAAGNPRKGIAFSEILQRSGQDSVEAQATATPEEESQKKAVTHSFGAQFCEVQIDPLLPRVQVTRWVSVIDVGRVMNPKTCRSQVLGGVTMGLGAALMEETAYDPRSGRPVTDNFADYRVPVNADVPEIEVDFIDTPDPVINTLGCRGVGEIGITGVAAAVANAVYHATGKRIRDLPITPDKLL
jgi:xanthine dehydrogenase YagR molybdenum-binding subunit